MEKKGGTNTNEIKTDACCLGDLMPVSYKNIVTNIRKKTLQNAGGNMMLGGSEVSVLVVQGWKLCPAVANCQT